MQKNYSVISACDNLLRKVLPILLVLALPWAAAGQSTPPTLTWSTDTTRIRIGEQIHLGLEVRAPKDALVDFPELRFQSDSMEVVGRSKIDTSYKRDEAIYRITYRLTSFEKGKYLVPAIEVKAGESILTTDPFQVQVSTVEVDTLRQARYGIKDIRTDRYTAGEVFRKYYWILIALAVAALLAWEIWRIVKRRREYRLPPEMLLSPYERAKFRLDRLDREKLLEKGQVKDFYIALTDVIRLYLDEQYGIPAPESTSDQTLRDVRKLPLTREQYGKLRDLLLDADLVKFAKMFPSAPENERYRQYTEELVESLRPAEAPQDTPQAQQQQQRKEEEKHVGD